MEYLKKIFEELDLPEKFLLTGHSCGAYLAALYASAVPERVEQLFLISPGGMTPYDEKTYGPHSFRDTEDVTKQFADKKATDEMNMFRE